MVQFLNYYKILTFRKICNFIQIETSRILSSLLKRPIVCGAPYIISVEPGSLCDLRCPECPTGSGIIKRENQNLDLQVYKEIIDGIKSTTLHLLLYFQGEPLLNNDIFKMIKYAKERGLYTIISTNGQRLNHENARKILESGLDRIIISVDGIDQITYEKYRIGGDIRKVLDGAKFIQTLKKENKLFSPEIIFQFLVFRHNENQVNSFRQFGRQNGADKIWIKTAQVINADRASEIIPANAIYSRYTRDREYKFKIRSREKNQCTRLWRTCVITSDGDVVPCCFDKEAKYKMGSLKDETLSEIWKNERYNQFRKRILSDRREIDICNNCSEGMKVYIKK
jgi:radical SAM protein with 4Fe4S-binding SPASM domain